MPISPLFVKYRTKSGRYYVYDPATNEIVRVGGAVYRIVDDYHVLHLEEIIEKHDYLSEAEVHGALTQLDRLQARGILVDHIPRVTLKQENVICKGEEEPLNKLLNEQRRLLVLELTQRCNLRCDYCVYGGHYAAFRSHAEKTMTLEIAKKAVTDYVARRLDRCAISFYGGEPLLEFELLKEVVFFANDAARKRGLATSYAISTNGTLLTDDKIHFLVEHEFSVNISLDGPKETHDRYRVFRNERGPQERRGSFDCVMKNLKRFAELYPEYARRGILVTLTATSDLGGTNELLRSLHPWYRVNNVNFVRRDRHGEKGDSLVRVGSITEAPCGRAACGGTARDRNAALAAGTIPLDDSERPRPPNEVPAFSNWTASALGNYSLCHDDFAQEFTRGADLRSAETRLPLSRTLFFADKKPCHWREVTRSPIAADVVYRCFPGAARTFYSAEGGIYPCERTETGELFKLGDCESGVDAGRSVRLMENVRLIGDCANCTAKRICSYCPAVVREQGNSRNPDAVDFQKQCNGRIRSLRAELEEYTRAMELNPEAMDVALSKPPPEDWLELISYPLPDSVSREDTGAETVEEVL